MYRKKKDVLKMMPIGYVRKEDNRIFLDIADEYIPGLKGLDQFSHVHVLWWFDKFDDERYRSTLVCHPPYDAPETGVFACRSPVRPNPIAMTTAEIVDIDKEKGLVFIKNIDADADSPIVDLKGYFPVCDRVKEVRIPSWAADWPEWFTDER